MNVNPVPILFSGSSTYGPSEAFGSSLMVDLNARKSNSLLNASDVVAANGDVIKTWQDQSGRGNHFANANAGQQPMYRASTIGTPSLEFFASGAFEYLSHADSTDFDYTNHSVYLVIQHKTGGGTQSPYGKYLTTGSQREYDLRISNGTPLVCNSSNDGSSSVPPPNGLSSAGTSDNVVVGTSCVISFTWDGTTKTVQINNNTAGAGTDAPGVGGSGHKIFPGTGAPQIGAISGSTNPYKGYIMRVVVANAILNATDKARFISTLMGEHGVA